MNSLDKHLTIYHVVVFFSFFFPFSVVEAYIPVLIEGHDQRKVTTIVDPELSRAFYGQLQGFPHTFEISETQPFTLFIQILQPDIETSNNLVSGIVIEEPKKGGRVIEVVRLLAQEASWGAEYEPFSGDTYRQGPHFEKKLDAGIYRIEVHTPDNQEKYVLVIGKGENIQIGYFELIKRLTKVKIFFDKSALRIIESPVIYIPVSIILIVLISVGYRVRKKFYIKKVH